MSLVRYYIARAAGAQTVRPCVARLHASQKAHSRTVATTSGGTPDSAGTPRWMWWTAGGGAVVAFYLWNQGHKNAKAAAGQEFQEHHGANQEYAKRAEGN